MRHVEAMCNEVVKVPGSANLVASAKDAIFHLTLGKNKGSVGHKMARPHFKGFH